LVEDSVAQEEVQPDGAGGGDDKPSTIDPH